MSQVVSKSDHFDCCSSHSQDGRITPKACAESFQTQVNYFKLIFQKVIPSTNQSSFQSTRGFLLASSPKKISLKRFFEENNGS